MPDLAESEINEEVMNLHQTIKEKFGYEMKYIRPPKGEFSERTLALTQKLGYKTNIRDIKRKRSKSHIFYNSTLCK